MLEKATIQRVSAFVHSNSPKSTFRVWKMDSLDLGKLLACLLLLLHLAQSQIMDAPLAPNKPTGRFVKPIDPPSDIDKDYLTEGAQVKKGRTSKAKGPEMEDTMVAFPSYNDITSIADTVNEKMKAIWTSVGEMKPDERMDREYIDDVFWPKVLLLIRDAHFAIKNMDIKIMFQRKPSALMDALFRIASIEDLQKKITKHKKNSVDLLTIRYFELSSAASQMHRFYQKRVRDILRDEPRIGMVAESVLKYKGYTWSSSEDKSQSSFTLAHYVDTPPIAQDRLEYDKSDGEKSDVWIGIRDLLAANPDVVMRAQFDDKICQENETLFPMEPAGLDGPYYVLFYLCLSDIKFYLLHNFALMYKQIYQGIVADPKEVEGLHTVMRQNMNTKIDLFDRAFSTFLTETGPSYQSYPGWSTCDPDDWDYDNSYFKLTNFIKVFVSKEQALHKAGNCKQTCDVLDATYRPCWANETDCLMDEEMECLTKKKQCEKYEPPCPARAYQCQSASATVSLCPSNRTDRLYEYIQGEEFKYGPADHECEVETFGLKAKWAMEQDTIVDTPHYCDICTCYCFEPMKPLLGAYSIRFVSLAGSPSLIKDNYITVGVKWERLDDQIHINTAEAKALPNYAIDESTIRWGTIKKTKDLARLDRDLRSVNLDDVVTHDRTRAVTGVKIYRATYRGHVTYNYIGIQLRTHPITNDGMIQMAEGKVARNANSTAYRNLFKYQEDPDGPDDPLLATGKSLPDTTSNQYLVFVGTSLNKDAGQQTIPLFDSQKLIRAEPKWLKGIGIYHKSRAGYGGFLAFKVIEHPDR